MPRCPKTAGQITHRHPRQQHRERAPNMPSPVHVQRRSYKWVLQLTPPSVPSAKDILGGRRGGEHPQNEPPEQQPETLRALQPLPLPWAKGAFGVPLRGGFGLGPVRQVGEGQPLTSPLLQVLFTLLAGVLCTFRLPYLCTIGVQPCRGVFSETHQRASGCSPKQPYTGGGSKPRSTEKSLPSRSANVPKGSLTHFRRSIPESFQTHVSSLRPAGGEEGLPGP